MTITEAFEQLNERLNKMDLRVLKSNLFQACKNLYKDYNGRRGVCKQTGLNEHTFTGMINKANRSKVTMDNLLIMVNTLGLDINEILTDKPIVKSYLSKYRMKWTDKIKKEFIKHYDEYGERLTAKNYYLKPTTVQNYYTTFKLELEGREKGE